MRMLTFVVLVVLCINIETTFAREDKCHDVLMDGAFDTYTDVTKYSGADASSNAACSMTFSEASRSLFHSMYEYRSECGSSYQELSKAASGSASGKYLKFLKLNGGYSTHQVFSNDYCNAYKNMSTFSESEYNKWFSSSCQNAATSQNRERFRYEALRRASSTVVEAWEKCMAQEAKEPLICRFEGFSPKRAGLSISYSPDFNFPVKIIHSDIDGGSIRRPLGENSSRNDVLAIGQELYPDSELHFNVSKQNAEDDARLVMTASLENGQTVSCSEMWPGVEPRPRDTAPNFGKRHGLFVFPPWNEFNTTKTLYENLDKDLCSVSWAAEEYLNAGEEFPDPTPLFEPFSYQWVYYNERDIKYFSRNARDVGVQMFDNQSFLHIYPSYTALYEHLRRDLRKLKRGVNPPICSAYYLPRRGSQACEPWASNQFDFEIEDEKRTFNWGIAVESACFQKLPSLQEQAQGFVEIFGSDGNKLMEDYQIIPLPE